MSERKLNLKGLWVYSDLGALKDSGWKIRYLKGHWKQARVLKERILEQEEFS